LVGNISKWGCGTILVLIAFVVAVGIAGAILLPEPDEGQSTKEPQKEEVLDPKEEPVRKPVRKSESQGEPKTAEVRADVEAYYDAAARGDYEYTYEHLTKMDRMSLSREEWLSANQTLQSDQATYEITDMRRADFGGYDVELTVNGEPRKTTFVKEFGTYMHELSGEELTMFTDALYSASAGTSASASAAPGVEPSGGNTVSVVDVVDGDTFDIDPAVKGMDRVRLIGVDTPEVFSGEEPCGQEASDFTTQQLEG
jgi:hypothetical protein